jgi:hypothetical protein
VLTLLALPGLLLLVNPSWLASALFLDPYIYLGYFLDLPAHLRAFPDHYISTRLPALLSGWVAHRQLPPLAANAVLHLGLYYLGVFSLYRALAPVAGRRAALLASIVLGGSPFFLGAVGWDYADGHAIAYTLLALALLQAAALAARPAPRLVAAGAALAALVFCNVFYALFAGLAVLFFLGANARGLRHRLLAALAWLAVGSLVLTGLLMLVNWGLCGRPPFFLANTKATVTLVGHAAFRHRPLSWLLDAAWLAFPLSVALGGGLWLCLRRGATLPWALLALGVAGLLCLERVHLGVVRYWYYVNLLLPFAGLAVGRLLSAPCRRLSRRAYGAAVAVAVLGCLLIVAVPSQQLGWPSAELGRFVGPAAAGVAAFGVLALVRPWGLAVLGFLLLLAGSQAWARSGFRYEAPWPEVPLALYDRLRAHDHERFDVLRAVADTYRAVRRVDRAADLPFWYHFDEPPGLVYREVACTHFLRCLNEGFPATASPLLQGPTAGLRVALLSQSPEALAQAEQALAPLGLRAVPLLRKAVRRGRIAFTVTVLELRPQGVDRRPGAAGSPRPARKTPAATGAP